MSKFSVGDVVKSKIGGPKMVVTRINDNSWFGGASSYTCQWFNKEDELMEDTFQEALLVAE